MRKNKLHIVIECNGTPIEKLKEYLQYVVLPNIKTGNETEVMKIEGHAGKWAAYYRALKPEFIPKIEEQTQELSNKDIAMFEAVQNEALEAVENGKPYDFEKEKTSAVLDLFSVKVPLRRPPASFNDKLLFTQKYLEKLQVIAEMRNDVKIINTGKKNHNLLGIDRKHPIVKELGLLARKELGYSKKTNYLSIVILLLNFYINLKNIDLTLTKKMM